MGYLGVSREAVMERLAELGVEIPRGSLPPLPLPSGPRVFVPYEHLMAVVHGLETRLPNDSGFGFNHDGKARAWVSARSDIDLEEHVRAVLADLGVERR